MQSYKMGQGRTLSAYSCRVELVSVFWLAFPIFALSVLECKYMNVSDTVRLILSLTLMATLYPLFFQLRQFSKVQFAISRGCRRLELLSEKPETILVSCKRNLAGPSTFSCIPLWLSCLKRDC
jgi:hypothetical protein